MQVLIFANGEINDGPQVRDTLLAARGAYIVAADGGAHAARHFGMRLHCVIGDMDSLDPKEVAALSVQGVEIRRFPPEKDETDLELALKMVVEMGGNWIRIIGGLGGRVDQTFANVYLLALPQLNGVDVRMVDGKQQVWLLHPGNHTVQGTSGDTLSLIPLGGGVSGITTDGLYYPLNDESLAFGPARGISNVMQTDLARISLRAGLLLAVHTIGRA